jgi:hypothetical protein
LVCTIGFVESVASVAVLGLVEAERGWRVGIASEQIGDASETRSDSACGFIGSSSCVCRLARRGSCCCRVESGCTLVTVVHVGAARVGVESIRGEIRRLLLVNAREFRCRRRVSACVRVRQLRRR